MRLPSNFVPSIFMIHIVLCVSALGQNDAWRRRNDRGNRYEGLISVITGNPDLEVLSFTGSRQNFDPGQNVNLKVKFYLPAEAPISITAQETEDQKQYWMEAKPRAWRAGAWNEFSPWPTGDVILKEEIPSDKLGVLVRMEGGAGTTQLIPALVYHSNAPTSVSTYTLVLRTNRNLNHVYLTLYGNAKGGQPNPERLTLARQTANVAFNVEIPAWKFNEGPMRLVVERELRNSTEKLPQREFTFYHKPEVR